MSRKPDMARRAELARAAFEILKRRGVHRTSMSALARELGMKRPTLYWYFDGPTAIFDAILEQTLEDQNAFVMARLAGIDHPIDLVYAYVQAVHAYYEGHEGDIVFLFQLWTLGADEAPARVIEGTRRLTEPRRQAAIALLRQGIADGRVAPCDPAALVNLVGAAIDGMLIQRVALGLDLAPVHETLWTHLLAPLKRPRGPAQETP